MSSSISSFDPKRPSWRRFVLALAGVFAGGSALLFLVLLLLDPWGAMHWRSPLPRVPADHSQRWAYPELARDARFDAAIIGNSASRLFNPAALDPAMGARFVNLAIVHGFAWEQSRLLDVFLAAHPQPRAVVIGLDQVWCTRDANPEKFGYDPIPEWLYDGDRLEALRNLFTLHAIETAWRSLQTTLGHAKRPYGPNGYALIGVDFHPYNRALARELMARDEAQPWLAPDNPDPATWRYPALDWLAQHLDALPASTRKVLVFVPRHHLYPAPDGPGAAQFAECKRRVVAMARDRPAAEVIDFSIPSPITTDDDLWWDAVHLRPEPMERVSADLARAVNGEQTPDVRILSAPQGLAQR